MDFEEDKILLAPNAARDAVLGGQAGGDVS